MLHAIVVSIYFTISFMLLRKNFLSKVSSEYSLPSKLASKISITVSSPCRAKESRRFAKSKWYKGLVIKVHKRKWY